MSHDAEAEAAAFDRRTRTRMENGHLPDLRRAKPCAWFYNNPWRHPEYANMVFGEYLGFALENLAPGSTVLEVGCGPGHLALELARNGHHVTGLDLSPGSIEAAEQMARENPYTNGFGSLTYAVADFMDWSATQRFDAVCFFLTLHHFEDLNGTIERAIAALRPGGRIVVVEPARDFFSRRNAAVGALVRQLLSRFGAWHETLEMPRAPSTLGAYIDEVHREYRDATDRHEAAQSPEDNSSFAAEMLSVLRTRFEEAAYKEVFALVPRMVGGVRGRTEEETLELARFLHLFDTFCVEEGLLDPGGFLFAGKLPG